MKVIKMAQMVLVVIGSDSCDQKKKKTMGWEVQQALKYNKQLMVINLGDYAMPEYLTAVDRFTKQKRPVAEQQDLTEVKKRIDNYAKGYYNIFSDKYKTMQSDERKSHSGELLDQYKLFQKTSEDLVARRQTVNSFYISVNGAMVTLVGVVMGLVEMPAKIYVLVFMCIVGIILDMSWISILESYGMLNSAKMKVIRLLEEQLPVLLYDSEWKVMSDKLNNRKYVSFTDSEKRIPKIFAFIYSTVLIISLIYGLICYFQ
ncbi:MAG: hypothetical protein Q4C20_00845 [Erysipelotrichaceae bacterium]|nr:hypothetical protein [Erysipelotrichaceae bacterium]